MKQKKYEDGVANLRQKLIDEGLDPDDEEIIKAFFDDATFADGTFDLPVEARWSTLHKNRCLSRPGRK